MGGTKKEGDFEAAPKLGSDLVGLLCGPTPEMGANMLPFSVAEAHVCVNKHALRAVRKMGHNPLPSDVGKEPHAVSRRSDE